MIKVMFFKISGKYYEEYDYPLEGKLNNDSRMDEIIPAVIREFKTTLPGMHMVLLPDSTVQNGYPHMVPADQRERLLKFKQR